VGLDFSKKKWWETDEYTEESAIPPQFNGLEIAGPNDLALVKVYENGTTQKGWGLNPPPGDRDGFYPRYMRGEFTPKRALHGYEEGAHGFAFVMRSMRMIVVDIDGKNRGLEFVRELGMLTPTLAETSKSGNGYHLWYATDERWLEDIGFAGVNDSIGIVQGVDIRNTGCVYHWPQQRWNDRRVAAVPGHLWQRLLDKAQRRDLVSKQIQNTIMQGDETEILMLKDDLVTELNKPIKQGLRNTTLFAIGNKMRQAGILDWEKQVMERGDQIGLPIAEVERIVANIARQP
jgi:hypothetical protein